MRLLHIIILLCALTVVLDMHLVGGSSQSGTNDPITNEVDTFIDSIDNTNEEQQLNLYAALTPEAAQKFFEDPENVEKCRMCAYRFFFEDSVNVDRFQTTVRERIARYPDAADAYFLKHIGPDPVALGEYLNVKYPGTQFDFSSAHRILNVAKENDKLVLHSIPGFSLNLGNVEKRTDLTVIALAEGGFRLMRKDKMVAEITGAVKRNGQQVTFTEDGRYIEIAKVPVAGETSIPPYRIPLGCADCKITLDTDGYLRHIDLQSPTTIENGITKTRFSPAAAGAQIQANPKGFMVTGADVDVLSAEDSPIVRLSASRMTVVYDANGKFSHSSIRGANSDSPARASVRHSDGERVYLGVGTSVYLGDETRAKELFASKDEPVVVLPNAPGSYHGSLKGSGFLYAYLVENKHVYVGHNDLENQFTSSLTSRTSEVLADVTITRTDTDVPAKGIASVGSYVADTEINHITIGDGKEGEKPITFLGGTALEGSNGQPVRVLARRSGDAFQYGASINANGGISSVLRSKVDTVPGSAGSPAAGRRDAGLDPVPAPPPPAPASPAPQAPAVQPIEDLFDGPTGYGGPYPGPVPPTQAQSEEQIVALTGAGRRHFETLKALGLFSKGRTDQVSGEELARRLTKHLAEEGHRQGGAKNLLAQVRERIHTGRPAVTEAIAQGRSAVSRPSPAGCQTSSCGPSSYGSEEVEERRVAAYAARRPSATVSNDRLLTYYKTKIRGSPNTAFWTRVCEKRFKTGCNG